MIATIQLPLWTLPAAFCVLCLIPDVIEKMRAVKRAVTERAAQRGSSAVRPEPDGNAGFAARSVTPHDDWARDGDWAA